MYLEWMAERQDIEDNTVSKEITINIVDGISGPVAQIVCNRIMKDGTKKIIDLTNNGLVANQTIENLYKIVCNAIYKKA